MTTQEEIDGLKQRVACLERRVADLDYLGKLFAPFSAHEAAVSKWKSSLSKDQREYLGDE